MIRSIVRCDLCGHAEELSSDWAPTHALEMLLQMAQFRLWAISELTYAVQTGPGVVEIQVLKQLLCPACKKAVWDLNDERRRKR